MSFRAYDIALQKTGSDQIKYRKNQEQLRLEQGKLPGEETAIRKRLRETQKYMSKVLKLRKQENAQHDDINKQVGEQGAKIDSAGVDLARQAGEAGINIGKYRSAALEQKKLSIANYQDLVRRFWRDTLMGLEVLTLKQGQFDLMIYRACTALSRAVFGRGTAKYRVIYPQLPVVTKGEMPPSWSEIKGADNRIGQIAKAEREQNEKIRGHEDKLKGAMASLAKRSNSAHDGVKKRVVERGKQLIKGRNEERRIIKRIKYLKQVGSDLSGKQAQVSDVQGQLARRKGQLLQGRAQAVANAAARLKAAKAEQAKRNAARPTLVARLQKFLDAKKAGKNPPKPSLPPWFVAELRPGIAKQVR